MLQSPPRNAPCPCGSGKRFKQCHGTLRTLSPEPAPPGDPATTARSPEDCRAAIDRAPSDIAAWNRRGEILRATDPAAAEVAWRRAVELAPDNAEAHFQLGNLFRERGEPDAARTEYERALASAPDHAGSINNLGLVLEALDDRERAEACYRRVLAANPQHPDALGNLASLLFEREAFRQSSTVYEHLCAVRRDIPAPVWVRRALAHQRAGDLAAAESCFREAAKLRPDDVTIQLNVGTVCYELQRYADAESAWLRAMELRPDNLYALSMLAHGRQLRCEWRELAELHSELNRAIESDRDGQDGRINPFTLLSMPSSPTAQLRAAQRWARGFAPPSPAARPRVAFAPGERLRVGCVSSDFRGHPTAHLSMELWERIDHDRFETFAYGIRERDLGPIGQRIERAFDHFADVSDAPVRDVVRRIRTDRIAILLDLNGTRSTRERRYSRIDPRRYRSTTSVIRAHWARIGTTISAWIVSVRRRRPNRITRSDCCTCRICRFPAIPAVPPRVRRPRAPSADCRPTRSSSAVSTTRTRYSPMCLRYGCDSSTRYRGASSGWSGPARRRWRISAAKHAGRASLPTA